MENLFNDELFTFLDGFSNEQSKSSNTVVNNIDTNNESDQEDFYQSNDFKEYGIKMDNFSTTNNSINRHGRNVQEIFNLSGNDFRYSYNSINFIETDHEDYMDIVDTSVDMQNTIMEGEKLLPTFKYLHEDIFMSLYQYDAEVLPIEKMHIQSYMNRNILKKLINTPAYIELRKKCRCDMFYAGICTEIVAKEALEILKETVSRLENLNEKKEKLEELIDKEEEIEQTSDEIDELVEQLEELLMQQDGQQSQETQELQDEINGKMMSLQQARQMAEQLSTQCEELVEKCEDLVNETVESLSNGTTIEEASTELSTISKYVQAWGLGEGNEIKVPFDTKKSTIEKIRQSDYLKKFTDMIGKYKECAIAEQKKKIKNSAVEIKSVKMGNKLEDSLPSDKMNLCNEITKKDFYRRMNQGQLSVYDKESRKDKNKGPIIICIDISGSMNGDRIDWAKALSVGILEIAQMQKRDFACIPYESYSHEPIIIHKNEINPEKIIDISTLKASGGTNFEKPLEKACKLIEQSEFKESDIVFITDGDCMVSENFKRDFKKVKEEKEFRTLGVLVDFGRGHCTSRTLDEFCDSVTNISTIADIKNSNSEVNKSIFGAL